MPIKVSIQIFTLSMIAALKKLFYYSFTAIKMFQEDIKINPHVTKIVWEYEPEKDKVQTSFFEKTELNFSDEMLTLIQELIKVIDDFKHIDSSRIAISAAKNKSGTNSGVLAYIVPLRYREGCPVNISSQNGKTYHWAMLPTYYNSSELLYIIYFLLPRFLSLPFEKKLQTVIHELLHINPRFNGDLRRFNGRNCFHYSHSFFEAKTKELLNIFLSSFHNSNTYSFLKSTMKTLLRKYGRIEANHFSEPKPTLIKVC